IQHPIDWTAFLAQIFFVFNWFKVDGVPDVLPGTGVVWSLSIEEQFYIVFAIVWLLLVKSRYWRSITIALAMVGILWSTMARILLVADPARIYYGTDTRLDGIAYGVLAAVLYHTWQTRGEQRSRATRILASSWALYAAIGVYLVTLVIRDEWFRSTLRFSFQSIAACVVIVYGLLPGGGPTRWLFNRLSTWRPVEVIGLASYSIYLVHLTVVDAIAPQLAEVAAPIAMASGIVIGCAVGMAMYYWIEVPVHNLRVRVDRRNRTRSP
ncbi:acyltransferase family protein, partial [Streptomyces albidoflavus]